MEIPGLLNKEEKQSILDSSRISLVLNTYDDIFSDFDPRPYSQRALSDDFLLEAKKASRDKNEGIELILLVPKEKRKPFEEAKIKKRLKEHFKKYHEQYQKETKGIKRKGLGATFIGIILMFVSSLVLFYGNHTFINSFLTTLLEPAGWFLFWEGTDLVIFESKKFKPETDFYKKMSKGEIIFKDY